MNLTLQPPILAGILSLLINLVNCGSGGDQKPLTDDECYQLGFNRAELDCSRCSELIKFELDDLKESCSKCCRHDESNSKKKFAFARLEYCECNIANFPQVKAFIRGDKPKKYSNLKIKFVRGALPILKLLNEHHDIVDELNIQKWDTDTIEEFLDQHIL